MGKKIYSGIGGQAVMEGILMRNGKDSAIAVRKPDGEIELKRETTSAYGDTHKWASWPVIRGVVAFVESMVYGMKSLMWSASFMEVEDEPKKTKADASENKTGESEAETDAKAAEAEPEDGKKKTGKQGLSNSEMTFTLIFAVILAIGIFVVLPTVLGNLFRRWIDSPVLIALIEGLIRVVIFIGYLLLISGMKEILRTYMYHGAEHKCINCIESGLPLTAENVMKSSKEHRRCGTSFLLFVVLISVVLFMFLRIDNLFFRILSRILLVPVIAGLSYELIRLNGRFDNKLTYILSRPGMWLQKLTTKEPTEDMAEVAIAAVEAVFDWRTFLKENFGSDDPGVSEDN